MTLGRTASNAIKIKTDNGTTRAVNCACCGPCPTFPDGLCIGAASSPYGSWDAQEMQFYGQVEYPDITICMWATNNIDQNNGALLTRYELKPNPQYPFYECPSETIQWELGVGSFGIQYMTRCGNDPYGDYVNTLGSTPWPNWGPITKCR